MFSSNVTAFQSIIEVRLGTPSRGQNLNKKQQAWTSLEQQRQDALLSKIHTARKSLCSHVSSSAPEFEHSAFIGIDNEDKLGPLEASLRKFGMVAYVASMCFFLPTTLLPIVLLYNSKLISETQCQQQALRTGEFCATGLLKLIPFLNMRVIPASDVEKPEPAIWVCNHTSMLDVFILLASDEKIRGKNRRPLKSLYVSNCWVSRTIL